MGNWDFDDIGGFASERDALRWADRNRLDPRDVQVRAEKDGIRLNVRRSAINSTPDDVLRAGRRTGW